MQIHGPSHVHGTHGVNGPHHNRGAESPSRAATQHTEPKSDQLEISPAAEAAINAADNVGNRDDLIARVRNEIATGNYETPEKLDTALDRLLNEIG